MLRNRINKIFASKIFFIIFSVLASITIWLYVAYVENPDVSININGVKVEFINKDFLADRQLVITNISADTVSLRFLGKRNTVSHLTNTNMTVNVDLAEVKTTGVFQLSYTIIYPIDVNAASTTITGRSADYISITVDKLEKKDIPVRGTYDGGVAEGFQAEPIEITPSTITVSGPQEELANISYAWVLVKRDNISKTYEDELPFTMMDVNGNEVASDKLTFSQDTVRVVIPVVMVKEIPLTVNLLPGAGADSSNTVYVIKPSTITISGDAETLTNLNQIILATVDLSKFLNATSSDYQIVLPNNTNNLTGLTTATVTVTISGLESKHMNASNIQLANVTAGYSASIVTKSLDIILRGKAEELAEVSPSNIRVVADLTDLGATTGTYSVLAKVYVDGDLTAVGPIGDYKVTVTITKD